MQTGLQTNATCNIQQFLELLTSNNVATVCTGLNFLEKKERERNRPMNLLRNNVQQGVQRAQVFFFRIVKCRVKLGSISAVSRVRSLILPDECGLIFPNSGW